MLAELYVPAFHIPLCVRWLRGTEGVVVVDFFKKLPSSGFWGFHFCCFIQPAESSLSHPHSPIPSSCKRRTVELAQLYNKEKVLSRITWCPRVLLIDLYIFDPVFSLLNSRVEELLDTTTDLVFFFYFGVKSGRQDDEILQTPASVIASWPLREPPIIVY